MSTLTLIGKCNHCGACCYLWSNKLKRFHVCEAYTTRNPNGRCNLFGTAKRPKECVEFPRCPEDLERVAKWCSLKFVDERGKIVEPWMDKQVKLTPVT